MKTPASREQVLSAIDRLLCRPRVDAMRPEFLVVFDFAESGDEDLDAILLGYFAAGAVKFDLENPALARTPRADAAAGIRAVLLYYRLHRVVHPRVAHPLFDELDLLEKQGGLERYIAAQPAASADYRPGFPAERVVRPQPKIPSGAGKRTVSPGAGGRHGT